MKRLIILMAVFFPGLMFSQEVTSYNTGDLDRLLDKKSDTLYVVNFWATWCSPCVREIGYFEELHRRNDSLLKVILVNLDFPNQVEKRVIPFIKAHNLTAHVVNMTEMDYNKWIPLVHEDWSGAIPATLLFSNRGRDFIGTEVAREELLERVDALLSK